MRVGHAQILVRIYGDIIDANFIVQVGPAAASAVADVADGVAPMHVLSGEYGEALKMPIAGGHSVAVVKDDRASIPARDISDVRYRSRRCSGTLSVSCADGTSGGARPL